ncbi:lipopolysaccharide biosynthesis protein [Pedobacter psychroterrae]|uniref:O-antigen/teichoic acid export membrane protein n=1 Tax=Pedobacter psychroterrae TaxID=2530453 RepID=A0A4V2MLN2_9SPHI|nr:hypothetical protein [Pedobacter psychroterrae]TCD02747.1 hypothetical protein EZ437_01790 [Pedobacter psychroterrae]
MFLSPLFKNSKIRYALYILVAQGLFMACNLYINHWINDNWHVEGFAIYNLVKRVSSFIVFPLLVGAGIAIPRYISFLKGKKVIDDSYEYLLSAIVIFCGTFGLFSLITLFFPGVLLKAFEDGPIDEGKILLSILLFIFSQGLYVLLSAYYRGRIQFGPMSLLNIAVMSILPLVFLYVGADVFGYFTYYSLTTLALLITLLVLLWFRSQVSVSRIRYKSYRLFKFGYPRIVAELGLFALEFMPVFMISLFVGLTESGYMSMTFILLKLGSMFYELVGSLILPYFGKLFKSQPPKVFVSRVDQLLIGGLITSICLTIGFYFFIPVAIEIFFPSLSKAISPSQMVYMAFPVYSLYLLLRNILDIMVDKAYNSINLSIVFVIQLLLLSIGFYFENAIFYSILSLVIPYIVLGLLTYFVWITRKSKLVQG